MKILKTIAVALFAVLPLVACTVEQTEQAELPDIDVEVEGGNLPKFDVDTAEVEIGLETKQVEVPDVDVDVSTQQVDIKVPDVDIDMPDEKVVDDAPDDDGHDS